MSGVMRRSLSARLVTGPPESSSQKQSPNAMTFDSQITTALINSCDALIPWVVGDTSVAISRPVSTRLKTTITASSVAAARRRCVMLRACPRPAAKMSASSA